MMFPLWGLNHVSSNQSTGNRFAGPAELQSRASNFKMGKGFKPKANLGGSWSGSLDFGNSGNLSSAGVLLGCGLPNLLVGWRQHGVPVPDPGDSAHPPGLVPLGSFLTSVQPILPARPPNPSFPLGPYHHFIDYIYL